jgi:hypothetical protein
MKAARTTTRRSFLRRVGATATAGAALALVSGSARAQNYSGVTDCDAGQGADPPGNGRGTRNQVSDQDTGPNSDPRCHGRGSNSGSPSGTRYNPGTQPETGCSDSDYGAYADPSGHGRTCRGLDPNYSGLPRPSGCTDRDSGSGADSIGNGRHC